MYIYKKSDHIVSDVCGDHFENGNEKDNLLKELVCILETEKLINLRRHIEVCELCNPPEEVYVIVDGKKKKLPAAELFVCVDGTNYVISTKVIHDIQAHNCKPKNNVIAAIGKYYESKYS